MFNRFLERLNQRVSDYGRVICHAALNDPIPQEWDQYVTQSPIALEVIQDVLFDTNTYTSATTTEIIFFAQSLASVKKDITNMSQPGMLPNPESFLVMAPRIFVKWVPNLTTVTLAASLAVDLATLFNTAIVTFKFGNKNYGPFPAWMFGAGGGPDVRFAAAGATATNAYISYGQLSGLFAFFPHLMISPLQNFNATMSWPSGAVTLGAGNPAIEMVFEGQRARAIQ